MGCFRKSKRKNSKEWEPEEQIERGRLHGPRPLSGDEDVCRPKSTENKPEVLILHLTLSFEKNEPEIIQLLEKLTKDPNYDINKPIEGYALIHRACLVGKPNVLEQLIKHGADFNKKNRYGDTPLMCVLQRCNACDFREMYRKSLCPNEDADNFGSLVCYSHIRCAKILLNQPNIDLDAMNNNGLTAFSFASCNHDEMKRDKYLRLLFRSDNNNESFTSNLYKAIQGKLDSQFVMELNLLAQKIGEPKTLQFMYKNYTLLQIVCKFGMLESAKRLVEMGADVHLAPIMKQRPIQLSCRFAQPHILEYLIQKHAHILPNGDPIITKNNRNLIHQTVKSFADKVQSHKCLKILLKEKSICIGDVNDQDEHGRTPLHYAVAHDNEPCVIELLENGALIDLPDKWKRTPLMHISPEAFKKYLNNMISGGKVELDNLCAPGADNRWNFRRMSNFGDNRNVREWRRKWRDQNEKQDELIFNYETLFRKQDGHYFFPTDFLSDIKKVKRLRKIIAHPVFSIIIHFKWQNIRLMFYFYLILYTLFCISFTVLVVIEADLRNSSLAVNNGTQQPARFHFFTENSGATIFLNTMLSIFALLEILKIFGDIKKYVMNLDNILRLTVITLSFIVIQCLTGSIFDGHCPRLKAVAILITWFELFLVTGKHPKLSFHVTTFRSASLGLFKFLIIHFVLLLGFALSFHTLFRSDEENIFTNPLYATFKTVVMLTSEFDAGEIPFHGYTGISHLIFIAYIFIATIVLFNLMIGLAFSKVNEMEKNPFLYESLAQIDIITHFEDYFYKSSLRKRLHSSRCCRKLDEEELYLRTGGNLSPKVIIKKNNRMERILKFESEGMITVIDVKKLEKLKHYKFFKRLMPDFNRISNEIVEKARKIVSKKVSENEESKEDIINLNTKLDAIANGLAALRNSIDELKGLQKLQKTESSSS